jgi:hypothetical protein
MVIVPAAIKEIDENEEKYIGLLTMLILIYIYLSRSARAFSNYYTR